MAEPTLMIKNTTGATIDFLSDDGLTKGSVPANDKADVVRSALLGAAFRSHVAKGNLTFVGPNTPAEQALGIEVMGVLLGTLGQTILTTAKAMPDARRTLADRRTAYNEAWQKAHDLIQSGNEYKDGANALVAGAKLLLAPDGAQASVKELTDKLTACDTKFVADVAGVSEADEAKKKKAIQDLTTQYLADREQLEADLAKAQEALRQAQSPIAPSLIAAARALESACPALDATKPGDIGQAIAAW